MNVGIEINSIKSESDYLLALQRLEVIFDAAYGTKEGEELLRLSSLILEFEEKMYPVE